MINYQSQLVFSPDFWSINSIEVELQDFKIGTDSLLDLLLPQAWLLSKKLVIWCIYIYDWYIEWHSTYIFISYLRQHIHQHDDMDMDMDMYGWVIVYGHGLVFPKHFVLSPLFRWKGMTWSMKVTRVREHSGVFLRRVWQIWSNAWTTGPGGVFNRMHDFGNYAGLQVERCKRGIISSTFFCRISV